MHSTSRARSSQGWDRRKRPSAPPAEPEVVIEQLQTENDELRARLAALERPLDARCPGIYNMDRYEDKLLLADVLWKGTYLGSMTGLREANAELVGVLQHQLKNNYHPAPHLKLQAAFTKARLLDGILSCMARAHSQKSVTVLAAALSVLAECNGTTDEFWDAAASFLRGGLTSNSWVETFMQVAVPRRPLPAAGSLPRVLMAVFDNLTMKCNYGSYFRDGETGIQLNMTNWLWTTLPPVLAPNLNLSSFGAVCVVHPHTPTTPPQAEAPCFVCVCAHRQHNRFISHRPLVGQLLQVIRIASPHYYGKQGRAMAAVYACCQKWHPAQSPAVLAGLAPP